MQDSVPAPKKYKDLVPIPQEYKKPVPQQLRNICKDPACALQ